ncbi:hypothetical protein PG994_004439 [Apiospora phragmitis]|uniref:Uncharacterized protein n=1 Tax=Apiospora phragmitis TaxID=2905665 RepID=A0ABR1VQL4_9PEZI
MDGLTAWLTATIRREGVVHDGALAGLGTVYGNQTCIAVIWGLIAFPAVLFLLTLAFVALTIVQSGRHTTRLGAGRGPWKSSALPVLWAGLEYKTRFRPDHCLSDVPDMEAHSERVTVRLGKTVVHVVGPEGGSEGIVQRPQGRWTLQEC